MNDLLKSDADLAAGTPANTPLVLSGGTDGDSPGTTGYVDAFALFDDIDAMLAEPFAPLTFSPVGAAVYQIGPFGTAARRLSTLA